MAMRRTISNAQLTPEKTFLVRGKVSFCRITRQTTDKEREDANKRRSFPIGKNYTSVSLYDAHVQCVDPSNPTLEERYAAESFYTSSNAKFTGNNFSAMNQSRNLPAVGIELEKGSNHYVQITPQGELAQGLEVILVMRVFKGAGNNGVSLDRILVQEPIRYYGGSSAVESTLANFGITFQAMAPAQHPASEEQIGPEDNVEPTPAPAQNNAFAPAQPAPQPVQEAPAPAPAAPAATDNPFSSYAAPNDISFGPGAARQY